MIMTNEKSYILVRDPNAATSGTINPIKLVTDKQIEITDIGKSRAPSFEAYFEQYGATKASYVAKSREIDEQFKTDQASASASSMYRLRVRKIQSDEVE